MKQAILLMNFGAPEIARDAKQYLSNIFSDPAMGDGRIFHLIQPALKRLIPAIRRRSLEKKYKMIGGGSPLNMWTEHLRSALRKNIFGLGHDMRVYAAMRYFEPDFQTVAEQIAQNDIDDLLVIPLYPFFTEPVTGAQFKHLEQYLSFKPKRVDSFFDHPLFIEAWAERIRTCLKDGTHLVFSAHSIPAKLAARGDPYVAQIERCAALICERLKTDRYTVSYQSAPSPFGWMRPTTTEVLKELSARNITDVCLVPISFLSDHLETLYDMDIVLVPKAKKMGIKDCVRAPSLNDSPLLVDLFTEIALGYLKR